MLAPSPGTIIARKYRVERTLGAGGMGLVLAATHLELERMVALKILLPHVAQDASAMARFAREGKLAAKIASDHVARVLDVGQAEDGTPFLVMEYLDGEDLMAVVKARGALPVEESVEYVLHACDAVAVAHSMGIVHRDLKPANLFLTHQRDGAPLVKVLDFGISKVLGSFDEGLTTGLIGSPVYMSPEQMTAARDVDARTDIWSLGAILFRLLAGKPPYDADNVVRLAHLVATRPPRSLRDLSPHVPPGLEQVVLKALARDPDERFLSVRDLALALRPFAPARVSPLVDRIAGSFAGQSFRASPRASERTASAPSFESLEMRPETLSSHSSEKSFPTKKSSRSAWILALGVSVGIVAGVALLVSRRHVVPTPRPTAAASESVSAVPAPRDVTTTTTDDSAPTDPTATAAEASSSRPAGSAARNGAPAPKKRPHPDRPLGHADAGADSWGWSR